MRIEKNGQTIIAYPEGRITSDNAKDVEQELRAHMEDTTKEIIVDAENLQYISSAGLRVLLVLSKEMGHPLIVQGVNAEIYEIFEMTGFTEILDVRKKVRKINVEGCEVIGQGAFGTVYRIDDENIVKVYDSPDLLPLIETEQKRAKQAFISGLPTAISYDIVRVGNSYGSVFELLKAHNLNDVFIQSPERADELLHQYVQLIHQVHSAKALSGDLPNAGDIFLTYVQELKEVIPEEIRKQLTTLLEQMPEEKHMVHGDMQMKNVMMNDGELILIDMETLSLGNPVFDLQALYVTYVAYGEDEPENPMEFLGIPRDRCLYIWEHIIEYYFEGYSPEQIEQMENIIRVLGSIRFLDRVVTHGLTKPELKETRINRTLEHLRELLPKVDTLCI
ncbi:MAG: phosphotransferase [Lachnospiraceae bacterium]|nr:phosphotransferase [Lachnospiraceae bacterium]